MDSILSGLTPVPHSSSKTWTSRPIRCAKSIHKWLNWPNREAKTLSPGESVLQREASQAPVPDEGKINTCPSVLLKTLFKS